MGAIKKIVGLIAIAALTYYAPGIGTSIAKALGSASGFLGKLIGAVVLVAGTYVITAVLGLTPRAPDMEAGKVNVRLPEPERWLHCGLARSGGGALFGEWDANGSFWYIIVHSDEILHPGYTVYLDDVPVTLDANNYVLNKEFRLKTNKDKDPAESDGQGKGYVRVWTRTYSESDPVPPRVAALDAALGSKWTADHKLVGTTFSVVCIEVPEIEHRYKILQWRGAFGMGEPTVSIAGEWANVYDPRDPEQVLGDRTTYKKSSNSALVAAWFRTHPYGRGKPESSVDWDKIAEQADICDQTVVGIESTQKRYTTGIGIVDSKRRADAEKEILASCDGQIFFDSESGGKWYIRVGHYYAPTLTFTRNRDIMAMSSVEAQDGESETQGVIVRYTDPDAHYTAQPSAAWLNPIYYDPTKVPKFLVVDILAIHNHNQAMRVAKGIGMRSQPRHKIGPTVNLRGLRAREERICTFIYDNTFAGEYEIATNVELDASGIFTGFGAVPISPDRWTLLAGEEHPKPVIEGSEGTVTFPPISGETISVVEGSIVIEFPAIPRPDATYTAEYILVSEITGSENDPWRPMAINVNTANSGLLVEGQEYRVRYRYTVASGRGSAWEYDTVSTAIVMPKPTNLTVVGGVGEATVAWRNPNDLRFFSSDVYRSDTNDFDDATKVVSSYVGGVGQPQSITNTVTAGTWYYWVVATDGASIESAPQGPVSGVVT